MNIGIIIPTLEPTQLAFEVIDTINQEILNNSKHNYRIFFEEVSTQVVAPMCAVMNIAEIWHYQGLLISTTLDNTLFSLKVASNLIRAFYLWDLEWLRSNKDYLANIAILRHPELLLIARNEECAFELNRYCNRQPNFIMPQLRFADLADAINQ